MLNLKAKFESNCHILVSSVESMQGQHAVNMRSTWGKSAVQQAWGQLQKPGVNLHRTTVDANARLVVVAQVEVESNV